VFDPGDPSSSYERGTDFTVDYGPGQLQALPSGSLSDNTDYSVSYSHRLQGLSTIEAVPDPRIEPGPYSIPGLTTQSGVNIAAETIAGAAAGGDWTTEVTVPASATGWDVISEVNPERVPSGGKRTVSEAREREGRVEITYEGASVGDLVEDFSRKVNALARRV
jgi:hypothetical protein